MKKNLLWVGVLALLILPTFSRMFQYGLPSMQDFPYFRIVEYSKCLLDFQLPCRWSPDAGLGYGEPIFNFYAPLPFFVGAIFANVGFGSIVSLKILFALSLLLSACTMFLFSKRVWGNNYSALVSAVVYTYAPYRAVNVWVRGALAESLAFIFLPLILWFFEGYLRTKKINQLLFMSVSLSLLILTHNLSAFLFAPIIVLWVAMRLWQEKSLKLLPSLLIGACISILLSAFYLLPVLVESKFINISSTTLGYFDFRAHFVTAPQLFFSRYWGYGGSTWGNEDGLSLSIGLIQWVTVLATSVLLFVKLISNKGRLEKEHFLFICFTALGALSLLFTHNKSTIVWESFSSVMKYIQFPWRFLGMSLFCFSIAIGLAPKILKHFSQKFVVILIIISALALNTSFFREDIWYVVDDREMQSGDRWIEQTRASIGDYWSVYSPPPTEYMKPGPNVDIYQQTSNSGTFLVRPNGELRISLPIMYFPGWVAYIDGQRIEVSPGNDGLVTIPPQLSEKSVRLQFQSTPIRLLGNAITLFSAIILLCYFMFASKYRHEK